MNTDFVGYTGKTGSIVFNELKKEFNFKNLINSKNYKEYIKNIEDNTIIIDFSTKEFVIEFINSVNKNFSSFFYITGVTGFSEEEFQRINIKFKELNIKGFHFPNFSIGVNLLNSFVKKISMYFDNAEIIEMHHKTKKDKPSGTALTTSKIIKNTWKEKNLENEVNIHSVRLPSLVAHQTVIFSNEFGEVLEITHHSLNRISFALGVKKVLEKILQDNLSDHWHENIEAGLYYNLNLFDFIDK